MFAIIGIVLVFVSVVGGFLMEKGHIQVLLQPAELLIIAGESDNTVPLHADGRGFELHYAARSRAEAAYVDELECKLGTSLRVYAADRGERLDVPRLMAHVTTSPSRQSLPVISY